MTIHLLWSLPFFFFGLLGREVTSLTYNNNSVNPPTDVFPVDLNFHVLLCTIVCKLLEKTKENSLRKPGEKVETSNRVLKN